MQTKSQWGEITTYSSYDPREDIRSVIGTSRWMAGHDEYVISVTDDMNDTIYLPLVLPGESRGEDAREMPLIEMILVTSLVGVHNVQGTVRDQEAYIDFNIYYANTDNITPTKFGKTVADELVSQIMTDRHSTTVGVWMEVINDGREIIEETIKGKSVIYHRVVEVLAKNYDDGV